MFVKSIILITYLFIYCISALPAYIDNINQNVNNVVRIANLKDLKNDLKEFKDKEYFNKKNKNVYSLFENFSKIEKRALKVSTMAQMYGAPKDIVDKIKAVEKEYEDQGKTLTLSDAFEIAEKAGLPESTLNKLKLLAGFGGGNVFIPPSTSNPIPTPNKTTTTTTHHTTTTTQHATTKTHHSTTTTHHSTTTTHHSTTTTHHSTTTTHHSTTTTHHSTTTTHHSTTTTHHSTTTTHHTTTTTHHTTTIPKTTTTTKSVQTHGPSVSEIAEANGAPASIVQKIKQVESLYALQGKTLTLDEVIRLSKIYGIPDDVIEMIKNVNTNIQTKTKTSTVSATTQNIPVITVTSNNVTTKKSTTSSHPQIITKTVSTHKSEPTKLPNQQSFADLAEANGAPAFLVEKARQLEKEYAAQGKTLTLDEVIRLARSYGATEDMIQQIKDIINNANGNNNGNNGNSNDNIKPLPTPAENNNKPNQPTQKPISNDAGIKNNNSSSGQQSMSELAAANGAPPYLVEKVKQLEKEYAAKGKVLTIDDVVKIAKGYGIPDSMINQVMDIYKSGNNNSGNFGNVLNDKQDSGTKDNASYEDVSTVLDNIISKTNTSTATNTTTTTTGNGITSSSTFSTISISELAAAMGVSDKMLEKVKKYEALAAAQGTPITIADLCNIAEALGYPHAMVEKIREADAKAQAEGRILTLSELADVAEEAGVSPEKVARLRQVIKERNLDDGIVTTNGLLPNNSLSTNNTLVNTVPMNNTVPLNSNIQTKDKSTDEGGFNYWIVAGIVAVVIVIVIGLFMCCRSKK
ncbi:hypothetical protein BCR36DRAFT_190735 [Piromyces finnis]|uniref:LysM domain-containing protein n=1 Tax=Piromyces finnis TaxID=1754191 RepID=A0A1Y1UQN9_9FUNG|nr:hypothetical protein BCR36DRAFT_190735 [Piromyces finnis]|eukprot:ORX40363.1 hypothetical protein BCR36DRAFT_190735 [Piromyces finnis]